MNATRKLLPLILFPALFSADINLAQAADFSISKAIWRNAKDKLVIKGLGEPGARVNAFVANSILPIGSATVNKKGIWRIRQVAPPFVPCEVDVVSGVEAANKLVARAPSDCFVAGEDPNPEPDPTPENTPPVISGTPNTQVAEGQAYSFRPSASDADNDSLSFSIANRPAWASFNSATGQLSGTPDMDDAGTTSNIRISVSDGTDTASLSAFSITVTDTNRAPTISGSPATSVAEGGSYRFAPSANDADGDSLSFSIANRPSWASFNTSTGVLSGAPGMNDEGTTSNIQISVSDGSASASLSPFSISVTGTNQAPTISGSPATSVAEGGSYRFAPSANDADGDSLSFSIANRPSWASFNTSTGVLSGTPGMDDEGTTSNIQISVSDGSASASLSAFSITVTGTNQAPTISGSPATSVAEGGSYRFAPSADDADGDSLSFSIANRPSWASFNTSTGVLSGTPGMDDAGTTSNIRISVSDGSASASLSAFSITVSNTNRAPTISGTPATSLDEGSAYSFTPTASDPDGDALSFSVSNLPSWASFNSSTGQLSGTPDSNSAGSYSNIVISVSDGSEQASLSPFAITVADVAEEGGTFQFASNGYDVEEGSSVTLTVTRNNGNGAATVNFGTYGVEARHSQDYTGYVWTALNFLDGETSKTININTMSDTADEGAETFEVHLNEPSTGYTLNDPSVSVVTIHDVEAPNNAPVISGTPDQSVVVGDGYVFTPTASDADNDSLTFSISNLPSWASFNSSNGTLSGTPAEADEGSYNNIVISVSDGTDTASLSPLTLVVEAAETTPTTGSVSLNWVAPATRTDGSSLDLSEISGYRLYMGTSNSNLSPVMDVDDCTISNHVFENLETGTYYFAITAYDLSGNESDLSNVVAKDTM
ncbi:MAG: putative Ig domain-containing protein [Candidatus Thiodiazotropha endolucinida]|nr:putative Ig domain-containing protein [Candidatus Thiodiazotropha taylori]MCW4316610.1 putative Ig domain-containing protein [Candidatus Thiodiazotropha taylori]